MQNIEPVTFFGKFWLDSWNYILSSNLNGFSKFFNQNMSVSSKANAIFIKTRGN